MHKIFLSVVHIILKQLKLMVIQPILVQNIQFNQKIRFTSIENQYNLVFLKFETVRFYSF